MQEQSPPVVDQDRADRRCPTCATPLDSTGDGGDELLECPHCGLVMFA